MKKLIIAVDYDDTLVFNSAYGEEQGINQPLLDMLIKLRAEGNKIILWTCRGGDWLQEAVDRCKQLGLEFDAVNQNIFEEQCQKRAVGTRKVIADIYVDDRASTPDDFLKNLS